MKLQSKEQRIVGRVAIVSIVMDAFNPADLGNTPISIGTSRRFHRILAQNGDRKSSIGQKLQIFRELGVEGWGLGVGSWKLGVGSWGLGVGSRLG